MPDDQQATRKHAFGDDALGDHDAVGLAEEIRAGRVSRDHEHEGVTHVVSDTVVRAVRRS